MKEQSHLDDMRAAVRGDFERAAARRRAESELDGQRRLELAEDGAAEEPAVAEGSGRPSRLRAALRSLTRRG